MKDLGVPGERQAGKQGRKCIPVCGHSSGRLVFMTLGFFFSVCFALGCVYATTCFLFRTV